jgi:hypothetical protein
MFIHVMTAYKDSRGTAPLIFNLGTASGQLHFPAVLFLCEELPVPFEWENVWAVSLSACDTIKTSLLPAVELRLVGCPARSLVTVPTELYSSMTEIRQ